MRSGEETITGMESMTMSLRSTGTYLQRRGIHQGLVCTLIADRALARSIEIAPDDQQRLSMRVGNRRVWFNGARSNLNSALARRCVLHKDVTSRLLRSYGLSAPDNIAFAPGQAERSEEHTSELQSRGHLVCRLL